MSIVLRVWIFFGLNFYFTNRLPEAADVLRVYHAVNVDSKSSKQTGEHNDIDLLKVMSLDLKFQAATSCTLLITTSMLSI